MTEQSRTKEHTHRAIRSNVERVTMKKETKVTSTFGTVCGLPSIMVDGLTDGKALMEAVNVATNTFPFTDAMPNHNKIEFNRELVTLEISKIDGGIFLSIVIEDMKHTGAVIHYNFGGVFIATEFATKIAAVMTGMGTSIVRLTNKISGDFLSGLAPAAWHPSHVPGAYVYRPNVEDIVDAIDVITPMDKLEYIKDTAGFHQYGIVKLSVSDIPKSHVGTPRDSHYVVQIDHALPSGTDDTPGTETHIGRVVVGRGARRHIKELGEVWANGGTVVKLIDKTKYGLPINVTRKYWEFEHKVSGRGYFCVHVYRYIGPGVVCDDCQPIPEDDRMGWTVGVDALADIKRFDAIARQSTEELEISQVIDALADMVEVQAQKVTALEDHIKMLESSVKELAGEK